MKGLIYKDIVTNRGNIFAMMFVLYAVIGNMILALSDDFKLDAFAVVSVPMGSLFVLNICIPLIAMITGMTDNKTKWTQYAIALPGGYKKIIQEKYVLGIIGQGIGVLLSLILILVVKFNLDITWKILSIYAIPAVLGVGIFCILIAIMLPLILKRENLADKIVIAAMFLFAFGLEIYICFGNLSIFGDDGLMLKAIMWIMKNLKKLWLISGGFILLGILAEFVSYKITVKTFLED